MAEVQTLEDALEKVGGFGKFQLFALVAIIYGELPGGILGMLPVYAGRTPEYWDCTTETADGIMQIDQIRHQNVCSCNGTLSGGMISMVAEWNLVCEYSWVADFVTSLYMAGMFLGGLIGSQVSDWIGRKKTLYLSCLVAFLAGIAAGIVPSAYVYAASRFTFGCAIAAFLVVEAIYPMEFFTPKWRSLSGTLGPWGEGMMLLPVFALFIGNWRTLSWVSSLPMLLMFLSYPFLPESPRWLLQKNKVREAQEVLDQIAAWNGRPKLDDSALEKLAISMAQDPHKDPENKQVTKSKGSQSGFLYFLCNRSAGLKVLTFMGIWFSNALIYYTITFNTRNLVGDFNLNVVFQGLVDATGFRTAPFGVTLLGRKRAIVFYLVTGSIPLVGIVLMELGAIRKEDMAVLILSLVAKFFISGGWSSIKCFTGESFPTTLRQSAIGTCMLAASIGGILAPQAVYLGNFNPAFPYFLLGGLSVCSAILSFFLQETAGKPINESG